jgi:hypothetical protein
MLAREEMPCKSMLQRSGLRAALLQRVPVRQQRLQNAF